MASPRAKRILFLTAFSFLVPIVARGQEPKQKVQFDTVAKHFTSGHSERRSYVITGREEWERVWRLAVSNTFPPPQAPDVDFTKRSIIAVFQGDQPSDGYNISITKLVRSENTLTVVAKEVLPEDACKVLLVVTQPFHIIETDRIDDVDNVEFKIKQKIKRCQ